MKRAKVYRYLGLCLILLGVAWNLAGMLYGLLWPSSILGLGAVVAGAFYLRWSRRARLREGITHDSDPSSPG